MKQPLLISNPKSKDERSGMTGPILLVPELCTLSGLSEEARADFSIMKDIAVYTRIPPSSRQDTLIKFMKEINRYCINIPYKLLIISKLSFNIDPISIVMKM